MPSPPLRRPARRPLPFLLRALLALLAGLAPAAGCTAVVVNDLLTSGSPCGGPSDCAAGSVCQAGSCVDAPPIGEVPPEGAPVDVDGGDVEGPDGVRLSFPAGALTEEIHVLIERASSTIDTADVTAASRLYRISPPTVLVNAATLTMPLPDGCLSCSVFLEGSPGEWVALGAGTAAPGDLAALLPVLGGVIVAGSKEVP
jgi:hypothetical protein